MEIALAGKRKLGFVTGTLRKDHDDEVKSEAWETCNSMIISWILGSVSNSIKQSIVFVNSSSHLWTELERRFSLTNGSRKHKLNKDLYETKQQGKKISEYYTKMKSIWEELESLHALPIITNITSEVSSFLTSLSKQMEEHKLFQFLNGLDDEYGPQRSQLLMMTALPFVETACCYLEPEES
uniref:Retrotransposon gag domain-containing protein n=1 Tax=Chenopodium quinoa TaxID=63459 RepID=A0A803LRV8_CHEQI